MRIQISVDTHTDWKVVKRHLVAWPVILGLIIFLWITVLAGAVITAIYFKHLDQAEQRLRAATSLETQHRKAYQQAGGSKAAAAATNIQQGYYILSAKDIRHELSTGNTSNLAAELWYDIAGDEGWESEARSDRTKAKQGLEVGVPLLAAGLPLSLLASGWAIRRRRRHGTVDETTEER